MRFSVTYEIVTQQSAEHGDVDERGWIAQDVSLRDAIDAVFETRTSHCDGVSCIEGSSSVPEFISWVTVTNGMEYLTGAYESRSIHFPEDITVSSAIRIARLMGAYGV